MTDSRAYRALGVAFPRWDGTLDTIDVPGYRGALMYTVENVFALCPETDTVRFYTVEIVLDPNERAPEAVSLALYLGSFHDRGIFAEHLAQAIAGEIGRACKPESATVTVTSRPIHGVQIAATYGYLSGDEESDGS